MSLSRTRTTRRTGRAIWFVWRANLIGTCAKGHEYFLKHLLGTHNNGVLRRSATGSANKEVKWHERRRPASWT